ncbi:MAG: DEAD/DEAH box helicase [Microthrixaceae bacterium]|nr:DEAD/DEAH box helicase [Microthrixaceae bacterium]
MSTVWPLPVGPNPPIRAHRRGPTSGAKDHLEKSVSSVSTTVPEGTVDFASLGVAPRIVESLSARDISSPFPIQVATIPPALDGRDVCGRAPTGSGKTLAFGIPLIERVGKGRPGSPRALVLVPTRELATQISDELEMLAGKGQRIATFFGGVGFGNQLRALRQGVDIAVACPGRLADLIKQGHVRLDSVDFVVLDEADRMADMGFLPEVKRLLGACADKRQTLLFSATLDGDTDVIIKRYMDNPVRHAEAGADSDGVVAEHVFWNVERTERVDVTAQVIDRTGPTVVFCRTKRGADRVARQLGSRGIAAAAIHGDRSQNQRERALEDFRQGRAQAIVATDVAARGIHVDGVTCVIHFDPTDDPKDYVHRSGRTGRAGNAGTVLSLVHSDIRRDLIRQQRGLGRHIDIVAPDPSTLPAAPPFVAPPTQPKRAKSDSAAPGHKRRSGPAGRPHKNKSKGANAGGHKAGGAKGRGPKSGGSKPGSKPGGPKASGPKAGGRGQSAKAAAGQHSRSSDGGSRSGQRRAKAQGRGAATTRGSR